MIICFYLKSKTSYFKNNYSYCIDQEHDSISNEHNTSEESFRIVRDNLFASKTNESNKKTNKFSNKIYEKEFEDYFVDEISENEDLDIITNKHNYFILKNEIL